MQTNDFCWLGTDSAVPGGVRDFKLILLPLVAEQNAKNTVLKSLKDLVNKSPFLRAAGQYD